MHKSFGNPDGSDNRYDPGTRDAYDSRRLYRDKLNSIYNARMLKIKTTFDWKMSSEAEQIAWEKRIRKLYYIE